VTEIGPIVATKKNPKRSGTWGSCCLSGLGGRGIRGGVGCRPSPVCSYN